MVPLAAQGQKAAVLHLFGFYAYGHDPVRNPQKAIQLLTEFIESSSDKNFMFKEALADFYETGDERIQDKNRAIAVREGMVRQGDPQSALCAVY